MRTIRAALVVATLAATTFASTACQPPKCKTTMFKYDHSTGPITWFTLYNEMRFCYTDTQATEIEWTNNRTSSPLPPYTRGGVDTSSGIESYEGSKRRARNLSSHTIECAKILTSFDVKMRQLGYAGGTVTTWRGSVSSASNC